MVRSPLRSSAQKRRGVVLLAVLVVLVLLSLAAWQYTDLMTAEYQAAGNSHRAAQLKALAESGVHYTAALLSNPGLWESELNRNPFHNPTAFRKHPITGPDGKTIGYFTLIAPLGKNDGISGSRNGVVDETGRINPNALMKKDPSGQDLFDMLKKLELPGMNEEIAAGIVDWIDADKEVFGTGLGAEDEYYSGLSPSYRTKNGPLDSIDELLLVKGVTEELLFGSDRNRNGIQDAGEDTFQQGLSAFLTVHSREQALNTFGEPLVFINQADLKATYEHIIVVDEAMTDLATFVVLYRQYGPASKSGGTQSLGRTFAVILGVSKKGGGASSSSTPPPVPGNLSDVELNFEKLPKVKIKSLFDLVEAQVSIPNKEKGKPATLYTSPLKDTGQRADLMPKLFEAVKVFEETDIPARINVNTAPEEVLKAIPGLEGEYQKILDHQPKYGSGDGLTDEYNTLAWLLTKADLKVDTLKNIEKLVTTRSQVYRAQVLAYLEEDKGPAARVEAVIDTNGGRPRIVAFRDLSGLGRTERPKGD